MSTPPASFLRLHVEPPPDHQSASFERIPELAGLCRAFESATGWQVACEVNPLETPDAECAWSTPLGRGAEAMGQLRLIRPRHDETKTPPLDTANASRLAAAIAELINGRLTAETALWQREAELASCVPVVTRRDEPEHLALRLEAILKAGAEAIGCQAAGLYLLDADTTQLKLRSAWGLPRKRLLEPPRLLASALGDLEALAGHAVVLEKSTLAEVWSLPEPFPAAVCVPVSTPSVPLGTLWLFSQLERTFTDVDLNFVEVVAGRLAVELEREMLLAECQQSRQLKRQISKAHESQLSASRRAAPLIDGWEISGWALQAEELGGAWFDWSPGPVNSLVCSLGEAGGLGITAAMISQTVRAAVSALASASPLPQLIQQANQTLWRQSAGDQSASLSIATFCPTPGRVDCSWAGSAAILHVHEHGYELIGEPACALGQEPEGKFPARTLQLAKGEALVLCTSSLGRVLQQPGHRLNAATLATLLIDHLSASATMLADLVKSCCESQAIDLDQCDRGAVVIKRA